MVSLEHCDEKRKQTTNGSPSRFFVQSLFRIFAYPTQEAPFFIKGAQLRQGFVYPPHSPIPVEYQMIDHISQAEGITLNSKQSKALIGIGSIGEVPVLLAKPQAYMNFTGELVGSQLSLLVLVQQENVLRNQSTGCPFYFLLHLKVGLLAAYYQVPLRHILLVYDEMSLPNGILRLQPKGGHGYLNGYCSPI
ncbi:hypothetical protein RHGRI_023187 [Rhododendron griersonianum]|uniref:Uncharacterized protein n=1 Tax=Rhododendron griersonianum TaxID=479676 RepID=A0AAV6J6P8_9ERIC|nr:hypothetical protein RHGRI_023187 [Rhododendron griersonianum]